MAKLFDKNKINLLRDLRKLQKLNWLLPEEYLFYLKWYPEFEKEVFSNREALEFFGITAEQYLASLSKQRSARNFNPRNKLGKPRHPWNRQQIEALKRLR